MQRIRAASGRPGWSGFWFEAWNSDFASISLPVGRSRLAWAAFEKAIPGVFFKDRSHITDRSRMSDGVQRFKPTEVSNEFRMESTQAISANMGKNVARSASFFTQLFAFA